jgi:hypothetical protein
VKPRAIALVAYVVLAGLSWMTISEPRIRLVTLAILAMFAVKTWVRRPPGTHLEDSGEEHRPM